MKIHFGSVMCLAGAVALAVAAVCGCTCGKTGAAGKDMPLVIIDTDIGSSTDDLFTFACMRELEGCGRARLIGAMVDRPCAADNADDPYRRLMDACLHYWRMDHVPIGTIARLPPGKKPNHDFSPYWKLVVPTSDCAWKEPLLAESRTRRGEVMDAVPLYRKLLAAAPDKSVHVCQLGFSTHLIGLLDSKGDAFSPLTGPELIKRKVAALRIMAGSFNGVLAHPEYNVWGDVPAARRIFGEWPSKIVVSPYEAGVNLYLSRAEVKDLYVFAPNNPIALTYQAWDPDNGCVKSQLQWDCTTVLGIVDEQLGKNWFTYSEPGRVEVYAQDGVDGFTRFVPCADGNVVVQSDTAEQALEIRSFLRSLATFSERASVARDASVRLAAIGAGDKGFAVLTNLSATASVDLSGTRFTVCEPEQKTSVDYTFPDGTTLPANGTIRLVKGTHWSATEKGLGTKSANVVLWDKRGYALFEAFVDFRWAPSATFTAQNFGELVTARADWHPED